jgi:hypothetical protein
MWVISEVGTVFLAVLPSGIISMQLVMVLFSLGCHVSITAIFLPTANSYSCPSGPLVLIHLAPAQACYKPQTQHLAHQLVKSQACMGGHAFNQRLMCNWLQHLVETWVTCCKSETAKPEACYLPGSGHYLKARTAQ